MKMTRTEKLVPEEVWTATYTAQEKQYIAHLLRAQHEVLMTFSAAKATTEAEKQAYLQEAAFVGELLGATLGEPKP